MVRSTPGEKNMTSKYEPLGRFLQRQQTNRLRCTFRQVEAALGFKLPKSARVYAPWWANVGGSHVQAEAWMGAGWRTSQVDIPGEQVTFERTAAQSGAVAGSAVSLRSAAVEDTGASFFHENLVVDPGRLSTRATRVLAEYLAESDGDASLAISKALEDGALERRRQMIERFVAASPKVTDNSVDLIREDRDAR
jgi:hypothetical protein